MIMKYSLETFVVCKNKSTINIISYNSMFRMSIHYIKLDVVVGSATNHYQDDNIQKLCFLSIDD